MRLASNVPAGLASVFEQRGRTALSALGIAVGTLAIVLLVGIAKGVRQDIAGQIEGFGANILFVIPGRIADGTFAPNLGGASYLKPEDARRVESVPGVVRTAEWSLVGGGLEAGGKTASSLLIATTPDWFDMRPADLLEGRTFGPGAQGDECVVGEVAKQALFGPGPAVGKTVKINGAPYRIVGVAAEKKQGSSLFAMMSFGNLVYIPYEPYRKRFPQAQTDRILVQVDPTVEPKGLISGLDQELGRRLDRQQFQVLTQEDLLGLVYRVMGILTWLLTGLTSIALFVGGVGIMTVMLLTVNERTREIGVRKAAGARPSDIFAQFLTESAVIGIVGGAVGLAVGAAVCEALDRFTPIHPLLGADTVGLALGVSWAVGIVFGVWPAMRAARKTPVEALRSE